MDIASWFVDTAALAGVVGAVIAFVKKNVLKGMHDWATVIASLAVGAGLGAYGGHAGFVDGGIAAGAAFGVGAGFIASGGWDFLKGLLGKRE